MEDTSLNRPRRRQPMIERKTAAFNLSLDALSAVDRLVAMEIYPSKSAAVDAALKMLVATHQDVLAVHEPEHEATL